MTLSGHAEQLLTAYCLLLTTCGLLFTVCSLYYSAAHSLAPLFSHRVGHRLCHPTASMPLLFSWSLLIFDLK